MRQSSAWGTHNTMREYASERGWLCGSSNVAPDNDGVRFVVPSPCSHWPQSEILIRGSSPAVRESRSSAAQVQTVFTDRPCRRSDSARRSRSQAHLLIHDFPIDAGLAETRHCHQGSCAFWRSREDYTISVLSSATSIPPPARQTLLDSLVGEVRLRAHLLARGRKLAGASVPRHTFAATKESAQAAGISWRPMSCL